MARNMFVLGGGISGLASAYYLTKLPSSLVSKITVLEASTRWGGWVNSLRAEDGMVTELGPRSIRGPSSPSTANLLELVDELEIGRDVLPVRFDHPAARRRFIYFNDQLYSLPTSMVATLRRQDPFSRSLASTILREPFRKSEKLSDDTVHNFFKRRLGIEMADLLIDPLMRGIYAGDARQLSIRSVFPSLLELEQKHGSLVKGAILSKSKRHESCSELVRTARTERWAMWSLRRGLQTLTDRLVTLLKQDKRVKLSNNCTVQHLLASDTGVQIQTSHGSLPADHVISTIDALQLSDVSQKNHKELSDALSRMRSCNVVVACVSYESEKLLPVQGFGYLVPSIQESDVLGVVFDSLVFPQHNGATHLNGTRLTCMMGGAWFDEVFPTSSSLSRSNIEQKALNALSNQLKVNAEPSRIQTTVLERCIPQFELGHHDLISRAEAAVDDLPVSLSGAYFSGPAVGDCVLHAKQTVQQLFPTDEETCR